ncbi:MAG: TauD/TfdA family dioxygenase [Rhodospirillaceae bacterium]|jgi:taurine dioxygenase|nr:TauD/TfdA family dioxygenase [Rhodospirillaceae bacterium]
MDVTRLCVALGAEVTGIDLSGTVDDGLIASITDALLENHVLVIRDQNLTPEQQVNFSKRFGELVVRVSGEFLHPEFPEVLILSNRQVDGEYQGATGAYAGELWHTDLTYAERPSLGSMLHALEVADEGGDTAWANMYLAYETLPEETRKRIAGLKAIHVRDRRRNPRGMPGEGFDRDVNEYYSIDVPDSVHPLVRTHPVTGRKSLFVTPRFAVAIEGMEDADAQPLLDELFAHQINPDFIYRHKWRVGDLVFWDNRCTTHLACGGIVPPGIRHLHRTSIAGDVPF